MSTNIFIKVLLFVCVCVCVCYCRSVGVSNFNKHHLVAFQKAKPEEMPVGTSDYSYSRNVM